MPSLEASGPNEEQIKYWNDEAAQKWVEAQAALDAQLEVLGRLAMDAAPLRGGMGVIDVGCGCGATTLEIARRVGRDGAVTGIDVSTPMLAQARRAAGSAANVRFLNADAQTHRFERDSADAILSRFGVMFFADPRAAFANLRTALRPGGRLAFVCWRSFPENPWVAVPMMAALQHMPQPLPAPPPPDAPGPFAFADAERVRTILSGAGFGEVRLDAVDEILTIGGAGGLDETVDFLLQIGPTARALREADPGVLPAVAAAVRAALEPYLGADGVRMTGAVWVVTATNAA